jgi:hypothetical protein
VPSENPHRASIQLAQKEMFPWFIAPWDAARLSWEAQWRIAFLLLGIDSSQEQPRQKVISERTRSHQVVEKNIPEVVGTAIPATTKRSERRPARNVAAAIKRPISLKGHTVKAKGTRRKR